MDIYVATVDTRYEVIAAGRTEKEAIQAACQGALEFLTNADALTDDTDTVEKIEEYFAVYATKVTLGSSALKGL